MVARLLLIFLFAAGPQSDDLVRRSQAAAEATQKGAFDDAARMYSLSIATLAAGTCFDRKYSVSMPRFRKWLIPLKKEPTKDRLTNRQGGTFVVQDP